ncbi:GTPase Era [Lactobacillus sp. W8089]|nr:GTPase Era [Lactobacillus sp. W8086]MBI0109265.1 GTPase Era [Lactobacillus sp. W8085]MBI0112350.1 GTPase Era [Lactobacillus sp. W8088]MBI0116197.1 GTPase Era [Lactobacillus sp. W8087]MBI0119791.1 GTPase Era [Lactobacillus sp. W8089]MBI0131756.1 GTPase Era [Lactobacillus sp. W8090]
MQNNFHSGFVALMGEPNVGKSTLMNRILGSEIAIISPKSQTTRNKIQGIYTTDQEQIVFVDTPGIHQPKNSLDKYMDTAAFSALQDVDVVLLMVNADTKIDANVQDIIKRLQTISQPLFLVINKIDLVHPDSLLPLIEQYNNLLKFQEVVPISATQGNNVAELLKTLIKYLPQGPQYYPPEQLSDHPEYFVVAEIIREKILELTQQEVPHSVAVVVEQMNQRINGKLQIEATIYAERASQKKILIGQKGTMIKNIGIRSREKIERLLGEKINLQLWIKVQKNWRNDPLFLQRVGYQLKDLK